LENQSNTAQPGASFTELNFCNKRAASRLHGTLLVARKLRHVSRKAD
jgi:hypothetical protein